MYEVISSKEYHDNALKSPQLQRNENGFQMALKNLKKVYQSGLLVAMGTDSGAQPVRTRGFLNTWNSAHGAGRAYTLKQSPLPPRTRQKL